jgi:hypothetical protein
MRRAAPQRPATSGPRRPAACLVGGTLPDRGQPRPQAPDGDGSRPHCQPCPARSRRRFFGLSASTAEAVCRASGRYGADTTGAALAALLLSD